jgi:hypothetical protein
MSRRSCDRIRRLEYAILFWVAVATQIRVHPLDGKATIAVLFDWSRAWYDHAHSQISDERIKGLKEGCANMYFESNPMTNLVT